MMMAAAMLAACERAEDTLGTVRRVPLPDSLPDGATLAVDSARHLWIGTPGRLMALDSAGRSVRVVQTPGTEAPRLLGERERFYARAHLVLPTDGRSVSGAARDIHTSIRGRIANTGGPG